MDIVIPFQSSINADEELRYALRTIDLAFPEAGEVWIVGDLPKWKGNYMWLQVPNIYTENKFRDRNICNKMIAAAMSDKISDTFLVAHDDNFLLQRYEDMEDWPYYHCGRSFRGLGDYANVEANTISLWPRSNNYDIHAPHVMTRSGVFKLRELDWTIEYGYCIKTAYANLNGVSGEFCTDLKISGQYELQDVEDMITAGKRFFSCGDKAWIPGVSQWLRNRFPNKSKYEL